MNLKSTFRIFLCLAVFMLALTSVEGFNWRNVCENCDYINQPSDTLCQSCQRPMNHCLKCGTDNRIDADYCVKCAAPLAEMRVLGSIEPEVREQLKLGESPRAQAELDIKRLAYLMTIDPDNTEKYTHELGLRYQQINFFSRESETWRAFIKDFPDSQHISTIKQYASESLRKWGYLMYEQGRYSKAVELLNEALQMNPDNKTARSWLGHASRAARKGDRYVEPVEAENK